MKSDKQVFSEGSWTAGIIGLGYVGLPLAVTAIEAGLKAIGYDVSDEKVDALTRGVSHVDDVSDEGLSKALENGLRLTTDAADLAEADAVFICVPSPLGRNRQPDLTYIESAARAVQSFARPGQLISLESTTYPGTTEDILMPAVQAAGLTVDRDVWVAFSPERVSPGDTLKTAEIPKVVGGVTAESGEVAAAAYRRLVPSVHLVSSAAAAEMAKLLENTYRAINIALVNEMAQLAHELDIDIWEVVDAAATKPFGYQPFWPGPGVGGHCIPLDPQFLAWRAKAANFATRFIDLAEQVNSKMPAYTASRISDLLNGAGLPVFGTEILAIGVSYKADVSDPRESASIDVIKELTRRGATVRVLDPTLERAEIEALGFDPVALDDDLSRFALAAVLTDHSGVPYARVAEEIPLVFDARGVYRRLQLEYSNVTAL